jgi:hypothetical protein
MVITGTEQAHSTCSLPATLCLQHTLMLPTETVVMGKRFLSLSQAKPKQNAKAILKIYQLFIYADKCYITNSL